MLFAIYSSYSFILFTALFLMIILNHKKTVYKTDSQTTSKIIL